MAHAKLTRISNVPETSILPRVVELPPIGDAAAVTTFGRHPDNDVRLDCAIVPSLLSRRHAEIVFDRATGAHFVKDKNSLNGTYVNGNLIPPGGTSLNGGDIIGFGGPATVRRDDLWFRNSLRFVYTPDPTRSVPPPISRDRVVTRSRARELARVVPPISGDRAPELARSASSVSRHHAITRSRSRARAREAAVVTTVPGPVWKAVSRSAETSTRCDRCRVVIPPGFFRMRRSETVSGVDTDRYFHAHLICLRDFCQEIHDASGTITDLPELSVQEKRIADNLLDAIERFRDL